MDNKVDMAQDNIPIELEEELESARRFDNQRWKSLGYFTFYRLLLTGLLVVLQLTANTPQPFGSLNLNLYVDVSYLYVGLALLAVIAVQARLLHFNALVDLQTFGDIVCITLLMHASGGIASGIGMMLVVSVAAAGLLSIGRTAILFAALASLAVLIEQTALFLNTPEDLIEEFINYSQAGMLGIALFATAALAYLLAQRAAASERLAHKRGIDLANMAQLTEYIIKNMQTGVLVADADNKIRFVNTTARELLGLGRKLVINNNLVDFVPNLYKRLRTWRAGERQDAELLEVQESGQKLLVTFMSIGNGADNLIFVDDANAANQQAQQLKLASIGRLTASIAHEIRNPLAAISHAGQLLEESPSLDDADKRLLRIVHDQSKRINEIIESVLHLGRRDRVNPEPIELQSWLQGLLEELQYSELAQPEDIQCHVEPADLTVRFDPVQFRQIVWNLCINGLRHAADAPAPKLEILAVQKGRETWLDVRDHGPGVKPEAALHLFEPFFTTESKGTGLGLYLAREMAECNGAHLIHMVPPDGGACFRLLFAK